MTGDAKLRARFGVLDSGFGTFQSRQNFTPKLIFARGHGVIHTSIGHRLFNDLASFIRTHEQTISSSATAIIRLYRSAGVAFLKELLATTLCKIRLHEQLHDMLRTSTFDMSQIGLPRSGAIGIQNDLVTWKIIHVIMRRRPFLSDGPQERLGLSVSHYHVHC